MAETTAHFYGSVRLRQSYGATLCAGAQNGAYGVRYLFVIYGFSVAETANLDRRFPLERAPETEGVRTLLTLCQIDTGKWRNLVLVEGLRTLLLIPFDILFCGG